MVTGRVKYKKRKKKILGKVFEIPTAMLQSTLQADIYSLDQSLQEYNASPYSTPCSYAYNSNELSHTGIYQQYDQFSQFDQNQFTDLIHNVITPFDNVSEIEFGSIEISADHYPNPNYNNNYRTECNAMPQFSVGRLEKNENEMRLNSSCKYPNKFVRNTIDRSDNKNVRSFKFATTNNGENLFLNTYPFTRVETNNKGLSYLYIDIAEYDKLRGDALKDFNKKCEDTFSQINLYGNKESVKSERLRLQKRNCKEKNKHRWDSYNNRYQKSNKIATKAVLVSEYENFLSPHTPDISYSFYPSYPSSPSSPSYPSSPSSLSSPSSPPSLPSPPSPSYSSSQEVQESVTPEIPTELSLRPFSQSTPSPVDQIIKNKSQEEYIGWVTPEEDNCLSMLGEF